MIARSRYQDHLKRIAPGLRVSMREETTDGVRGVHAFVDRRGERLTLAHVHESGEVTNAAAWALAFESAVRALVALHLSDEKARQAA